jgi:DNA-binding response OmpR family regulator
VASTVESGLIRAQLVRFDAILVEFDVRSDRGAHPGPGSGLKVIRQLRVLGVTAPILMFTAMTGKVYETASLEAGADDFILKTTPIPDLVSRLRSQIRRFSRSLEDKTACAKGLT